MQQGIHHDDGRKLNPNAYTRPRKKSYYDCKSKCPMPTLRRSKESCKGNKGHVQSSQIWRKTSSCTNSTLTYTDCSSCTSTSSDSIDSDNRAHYSMRSSKKESVLSDRKYFYDINPACASVVVSDKSFCDVKFSHEKQNDPRFNGTPMVNSPLTNNTMPKGSITPKLLFQNLPLVSDRQNDLRESTTPVFPNNKFWAQLRTMFSVHLNGIQTKNTSSGGIFCLCTDVEKSPECSPSDPYGSKNSSNAYDEILSPKSFTPMLLFEEINDSPKIKHFTNMSRPDHNSTVMKTVKRNNLRYNRQDISSLSDSSEIIILDKTDPDLSLNGGSGENVPAYRSSADFTRETNCYYRGFDGERNHYTYVLDTERAIPKKMRDIMTADKMLTSSPTSPTKDDTKPDVRPPQDIEQTFKDAKTVLHVISPVREKRENVIDSDSLTVSSTPVRSEETDSFATCESMNTEEVSVT